MGYAYRLQPAHRRKLRRMRELVDAADGSLTPDELAAAEEYLSLHASCEAYLQAQMTQTLRQSDLAAHRATASGPRSPHPSRRRFARSARSRSRCSPSTTSWARASSASTRRPAEAPARGEERRRDEETSAHSNPEVPSVLAERDHHTEGGRLDSGSPHQADARGPDRVQRRRAGHLPRTAGRMDRLVPGSFEGGKRR